MDELKNLMTKISDLITEIRYQESLIFNKLGVDNDNNTYYTD